MDLFSRTIFFTQNLIYHPMKCFLPISERTVIYVVVYLFLKKKIITKLDDFSFGDDALVRKQAVL